MPITIPSLKVHQFVDPRRIAIECLLDKTLFSDELRPIMNTQETQARDAVSDRNLLCRLHLAFIENQLLGRLA